MIDKGQWTQQGLKKFQAAIKDGEPVEMTHFIISGNQNLGSLADFSGSEYLTADTFPHEIFRKRVSYSYLADDGRGDLVVFCEIEADNEEEFFCNGIGLIYEDAMGQEYLMAVSELPIQQRTKTVNQTFEFKLPIVNDAKNAITVTFEPEDRVSQAQLSAAVKAHGEDDNAHEGYRNIIGPMLMFLADSVGMAHRELTRFASDDYENALIPMLSSAIDSAGLAHREHQKTLKQRFQTGTLTVFNRGIISGCEVTKSQTATRNLSLTQGKGFGGGMIFPVNAQENGTAVPSNPGEETVTSYIYLDDSGDLSCTAPGEAAPYKGTLLYQIAIPGGNTEGNDPHLANCTLSDLRRVEPEYPMVMTAPPVVYTRLPFDMTDNDYLIDLTLSGFSGGTLCPEDLQITSQASNGFSLCCMGAADNVEVSWTARKLDL